jgi:hypothetical protein
MPKIEMISNPRLCTNARLLPVLRPLIILLTVLFPGKTLKSPVTRCQAWPFYQDWCEKSKFSILRHSSPSITHFWVFAVAVFLRMSVGLFLGFIAVAS